MLSALWALDDEASLAFMDAFYGCLASAETTCISILLYFDPDLALPPGDRLGVDFREERAPVPNASLEQGGN